MKKVNLICALCAMAGMVGLSGCGDDSGSSKDVEGSITVSPKTLSMAQGDDASFTVTYIADSKLTVKSDSKDCVIVDEGSAEINTGAANTATVNLMAVGANCNAEITVRSETKDEAVVAVNVTGGNTPRIEVANSFTMNAGESEDLYGYYKDADGKPLKGKDVNLSNNDSPCVSVNKTAQTDDDGKFGISLKANKDADDACSAFITIKTADASKNIRVIVNNPQNADVVEVNDNNTLTVIDPKNKVVSLASIDEEDSSFTVQLTDANGTGVNGVSICFESDPADPETGLGTCAYVAKCIKTDTDAKQRKGVVKAPLTIADSECKAKIKAYVKKKPEVNDTVTVNVPAITEYNLKFGMNFLSSRCQDGGYAGVFVTTKSCDQYEADGMLNQAVVWSDFASAGSRGYAIDSDDMNVMWSGCLSENGTILQKAEIEDVSVSQHKSIVAFVASDEENQNGVIIGHACESISVKDATGTKMLEIIPEPIDITGDYYLVSNFDFTTGFDKGEYNCNNAVYLYKDSSGKDVTINNICVPAVEKMKAGDWVDFINNFASEPLITLLEFTWSNTLDRINADNSDGVWGKILGFVLGSKAYALPIAFSYANDWLKQYSWYNTFNSISKDVSELVTNMQFGGKFKISSYDPRTLRIKTATTEFSSVDYRWTTDDVASCSVHNYGDFTCDDYLYNGNPTLDNSCRYLAPFAKLDMTAMSGAWNGGKVTESASGADGNLKIEAHSMEFKWASIIYNVAFGNILPKVFNDYAGNSYAQTANSKGYYIKAVLAKFVFETVISAYADYIDKNSSVIGLKKSDLGWANEYTCSNFVKTLIEWGLAAGIVGKDAGEDPATLKGWLLGLEGKNNDNTFANIVRSSLPTLTNMICEENSTNPDYNLDALDKLVQNKLAEFEFNGENALNFKSENCPLYVAGTDKYQYIGKADVTKGSVGGITTAKDHFVNGKATGRCEWNLSLPGSEKNLDFKGIFHAVRVDKKANGEPAYDLCPKD